MTPKELKFCAYVEQIYRLNGKVPSFETLSERTTLGLTQKEYDRMWRSKAVQEYLKSIGLDVDRYLLAVGDHVNELSPLQNLAVNVLLDYNDTRPDFKKLKDLGISTKTYAAWKSDPVFAAYLKARVDKIVGDDSYEVDRALFERARAGDITAIKFIKEVTGEYRPVSQTTSINGRQVQQIEDLQYFILQIQEVLTRKLSQYPDLMTEISLELESIANQLAIGQRNPLELAPVKDVVISDENIAKEPATSFLP